MEALSGDSDRPVLTAAWGTRKELEIGLQPHGLADKAHEQKEMAQREDSKAFCSGRHGFEPKLGDWRCSCSLDTISIITQGQNRTA